MECTLLPAIIVGKTTTIRRHDINFSVVPDIRVRSTPLFQKEVSSTPQKYHFKIQILNLISSMYKPRKMISKDTRIN